MLSSPLDLQEAHPTEIALMSARTNAGTVWGGIEKASALAFGYIGETFSNTESYG